MIGTITSQNILPAAMKSTYLHGFIDNIKILFARLCCYSNQAAHTKYYSQLLNPFNFNPISPSTSHLSRLLALKNNKKLLFTPCTIDLFPNLCFLQKFKHLLRIQTKNSLIHGVDSAHFFGGSGQSKSERTLRWFVDS